LDAHERPLKRLLLRVVLDGTGLKAGVNETGVGGLSREGLARDSASRFELLLR